MLESTAKGYGDWEKKNKPKPADEAKRSPRRNESVVGPQKVPRAGSKQAKVIALLRRKSGVTLAELMEKFGWQRHTCRGLISTLGKRGLVQIETKKIHGATVYRAS